MGFFRKLAFWKKDDLDFKDDPFGKSLANDPLGQDMNMQPGMNDPMGGNPPGFGQPSSPPPQFGQPQQQSFSQQPSGYSTFGNNPQPAQSGSNAEMQVISAKLDALKATLDSINQRITNIERVAYEQNTDDRVKW